MFPSHDRGGQFGAVAQLTAPHFNNDGELVLSGHIQTDNNDVVQGVYQLATGVQYTTLPDETQARIFRLFVTIGNDIVHGVNGWARSGNTNTGVLFVNLGPHWTPAGSPSITRGPLGYNNPNYPNTPSKILDHTVNYPGPGIQPGDIIEYEFYSTGAAQIGGTNPVIEYISVGIKSNEVQHISIKSICLIEVSG